MTPKSGLFSMTETCMKGRELAQRSELAPDSMVGHISPEINDVRQEMFWCPYFGGSNKSSELKSASVLENTM